VAEILTTVRKIAQRALLSLMVCAPLIPAVLAQAKPPDLDNDVLLSAMRAELERSKAQLKMDRVDAPYYIEYRVFDTDLYSAEAAFGSLRSDIRSRFRFLRVVVRLGDYKQDSYFGQGQGTLDIMPVDDDGLALRRQLWLATDRAYKTAAESLTTKQAQLKQLTIDQPVDDFAHADPVQSVGPLVRLEFDPEPFKKMLQDASAVYKSDPDIETSQASLRFQVVNRYFVNSEGTVIRSGQNLYEMSVSSTTQAADGMSLSRDNAFTVANIKQLPSAAEFVARAQRLAATLRDLRAAPLVEEEYRGPVLFSADASARVFADLIGDNILGYKPELGKNARTTGAFAASYNSRVLPDFISVVSDPTISNYGGEALLGHYEFDDEGVRAQKVSLIEKGMLVNYLIGREPIRDFPASNGHARAQIPSGKPQPQNSNLIVTASQSTPKDEMTKKLMDLCKQRQLAYCYRVQTFGAKLTPRLLYKVWAKDGHEELVRGAIFGDLDIRSLRGNIIAAAADVYIDNHSLNVPHSVVAPSILFDELEVKRANQNKEKLPEYPAPALGQ
jgi:TldD protein